MTKAYARVPPGLHAGKIGISPWPSHFKKIIIIIIKKIGAFIYFHEILEKYFLKNLI
jgi:hypothetical protein